MPSPSVQTWGQRSERLGTLRSLLALRLLIVASSCRQSQLHLAFQLLLVVQLSVSFPCQCQHHLLLVTMKVLWLLRLRLKYVASPKRPLLRLSVAFSSLLARYPCRIG